MDCKYLETEINLKNDLITFTKQNLPTTKAETDLGTKKDNVNHLIKNIRAESENNDKSNKNKLN